MVHPRQPSPSPSQMNNPSIYTAPPPDHISTRPHGSYAHSPSLSLSFPNPTMPTPGALNTGWDRPPNTSYNSSPYPAPTFYGAGSIPPPPPNHASAPPTTPSSPYPQYNSGYNPSYAAPPPTYLPPPPPSHPHTSTSRPPSPPSHKPSLLDSLLGRR
ncbi:hypothetical protein H0H87_003499 [Tephrocybe sp. NHM501043]|nr:hypothetical protein H0H87_003499 [Tephrocybe sp. NHM501043]